jgi:hypothetical protein
MRRRWRRQGLGHLLRWRRGRKRPGRPPIASETHHCIREMSRDHRLWGVPLIHGELAQLGINVSRTTLAKYGVRRPDPLSPTWRPFIRNPTPTSWSRRVMRRFRTDFTPCQLEFFEPFDGGYGGSSPAGGGLDAVTRYASRRDTIPFQLPLFGLQALQIGLWCPTAVHRGSGGHPSVILFMRTRPSKWGGSTCVWAHP